MKRTLEAEIASKMGKTGWGGSRIWVWGHALRQGHREFPFRKSFSSPPPLSVKIPENSRYENTASIHPVRKLKVIITIVIYLQLLINPSPKKTLIPI